MYINPRIFKDSGITSSQFFILQLIKQKEYNEDEPLLSQLTEKHFKKLIDNGYLGELKSKTKSTPIWKTLRLTKKGKSLMRDIEMVDLTEQSKKLAASLISLYKNNNLDINKNNNKREVHELVAWFLSETDFTSAEVYGAVNDYINNTERKFISTLSNLIWRAENVYSRKWNLSKSKLYGLMT